MKRIEPIRKPITGEITVPGDKSIAHRAVIFSSIATGRSRIFNLSGGDDNSRTVRAFKQMGVEIFRDGDALSGEQQLTGESGSELSVDEPGLQQRHRRRCPACAVIGEATFQHRIPATQRKIVDRSVPSERDHVQLADNSVVVDGDKLVVGKVTRKEPEQSVSDRILQHERRPLVGHAPHRVLEVAALGEADDARHSATLEPIA